MFKELGAFIDEVGSYAGKSIKRIVSGEDRMPERTTGCMGVLLPEGERTVHIASKSEKLIISVNEDDSTDFECSDKKTITII